MQTNFTGAERVLFRATYEFAINIEKLTEQQAREKATNKVLSKRAMAKQLRFRY